VVSGLAAHKRRGWLLGFLTLTITTDRFKAGYPSAFQIKKAYDQAARFLRLHYGKYKSHVSKNGQIVASKKWRGSGAIAVMQFGDSGNLHFHCLTYGPYISQRALSASWLKLSGDSFVVDIRAIKNGPAGTAHAINYVMRYIARPPENEAFYDLAMLTLLQKGLRRVRCFGVLYNRVKRVKRKHEKIVCLCCGSELRYYGVHSDQENKLLEYQTLKKYADITNGKLLKFYGREDILWEPYSDELAGIS
jgi:hypothetical protein